MDGYLFSKITYTYTSSAVHSFCNVISGMDQQNRLDMQDGLITMIMDVLVDHTDLHYYQVSYIHTNNVVFLLII